MYAFFHGKILPKPNTLVKKKRVTEIFYIIIFTSITNDIDYILLIDVKNLPPKNVEAWLIMVKNAIISKNYQWR